MKKSYLLLIAAIAACVGFSSCSSDDDNNPSEKTKYSDKSYGQSAVKSCTDLCDGLIDANSVIGKAKLTETQSAYLEEVLANLVDNVIVPTYTDLASNTEDMEKDLHGLNVNTISQSDINSACESFKRARLYWEQSEAFLGGAASDFDVDPTIDSWPLNRSLLINYFKGGMTAEIEEDATVLGFHALEFILFRNGKPRNVAEFKSNDTYPGFESVSGADELKYAQEVCTLLKERTYQLQVAWEGKTAANASRVKVVEDAGLDYTTAGGLSYGDNLKKAGKAGSTFPTLKDAIAQILSDDEGSAFAIANEVGTAKIANPFSAGDISYVESPYSYNSIADFQDNIRSVRNIWLGTRDGSKSSAVKSFYNFFSAINGNNTATTVENLYNTAISAIGNMPAPFVKYCSVVWNKAFEDDNDWEIEE